MKRVEQTLNNYSERMKGTFYFSIAPLSLLISLFSVDSQGDYGSVIRGIAFFFGVISSPVLLLATPVTLGVGLIAGIAQSLFLPFQLIFSAINDVMTSSNPKTEPKSSKSDYESDFANSANDPDYEKDASRHFDTLFSNSKVVETTELAPDTDNSFTPH